MRNILLAILVAPACFAQEAAIPVTEVASKIDWMQILSNPAIVTLIATVCVLIIKYLHDAKGLDNDRWCGLVYNVYNAAEKAGVFNKWSGKEKLEFAMKEFAIAYKNTFGHDPSAQDLVDFQNDAAKVAADMKK